MIQTFPLVELSGSHYDVGCAIGQRFRSRIQSAIQSLRETIPQYSDLLQKNQPYLNLANQVLPNLVEELSGVAAGAQISPQDYFFLTNPDLQAAAKPYLKKLHLVEADHCSTLVSYNHHGCIVGHNEDFDPIAQEDLYLLKATINGVSIFGLQYVNEMIGTSASINNFGLVQCINELHSDYHHGLPKNFIARAVLQCSSIDQAINLISQLPHVSGFNHVLVQGERVVNIEIAGPSISVSSFNYEPFVHTNHYLSTDLQMSEKYHTASSRHRLRRLRQLVRPDMSLSDVKKVLRDHGHPKHTICRHDHTLGSIIFEPYLKKAYVCYGQPCASEYLFYDL